jgi:predicted nucleotidyltransferase
MSAPALSPRELEMIRGVLARHPRVRTASLFGSRAKGTHTPRSDVDLALTGLSDPLEAEAIAADLEELPMPCRFDVLRMESVDNPSLRSHIERVGVIIHPSTPA